MSRSLWIGKAPGDGSSGDEVYDRRMIAALRQQGVDITVVHPLRVARAQEIANLARGIPHYRARYMSRANLQLLADAARGHEMAICSWEPFDMLAWHMAIPTVPILHNITSLSLTSMFPAHPIVHLLASGAAAWQRRAYGSGRFPAIAVLSLADEAYVRSVAPSVRVVYAPPGLPAVVELEAGAGFLPELVLSGTFDWRPKRRDLLSFARDYAALGAPWPVYADALPDEAAELLKARPMSELNPSAAIRVGIVPDRFVAGHKLKVGAYLAMNCVVASFAPLGTEYGEIDLEGRYCCHLSSVRDLVPLVERLAHEPNIADHLAQVRDAAATTFSWQKSATRVREVLG